MKHSLFFLLALNFSLTSCQFHDELDEAVHLHDKRIHKQVSISSCERRKTDFSNREDLIEETQVTIAIERNYQRIIRKNCEGKVVSDQIETVRTPTAQIRLKPDLMGKKAAAVEIFHPETCDHVGAKLHEKSVPMLSQFHRLKGTQDGEIQIHGDLSRALFTFALTKGLNQLHYTYFKDCLPRNPDRLVGSGDCETSEVVQSGVFPIFIDYSEKTLEGPAYIQEKDCKSQ